MSKCFSHWRLFKSLGIKIWDLNTSNSFLQLCGLDYPEGIMGPMYGHNFRHFGLDYDVNKIDDFTCALGTVNS